MPYASPTATTTATLAPSPSVHPPARAGGHRRSRSVSGVSFPNDKNDAFAHPVSLPRRTRTSGGVPSTRQPLFHLPDDGADDSPSPEESSAPPTPRGLGLSVHGHGLRVDTSRPVPPASTKATTVPFPTLAPAPNGSLSASPPRSPSTLVSPIVRKSNGQLVKPSLKSSLSSSHIPMMASPPPDRAFTRSAPSTPSIKSVHFAEKPGVVLFDKGQRPRALSNGGADETETEGERDAEPSAYPFPAVLPRSDLVLSASSSPIPSRSPAELQASPHPVHLESVVLSTDGPPCLRGSVLVQNLAFTKLVFVRFTVDDWQTTSEVSALYTSSLPQTPSGSQWERFNFVVKLEDVRNIEFRKLHLVVRYTVPEWNNAEFWDNNNQNNYVLAFERKVISSKPVSPSSSTPVLEPAPMFPVDRPLPRIPPAEPWSRYAAYPGSGSRSKSLPTSISAPNIPLKLSHYVSPASVSPPTPQSVPRTQLPLSPPESPVMTRATMRLVGGHPATIVAPSEEMAPNVSQKAIDDKPIPSPSQLTPPSSLRTSPQHKVLSLPSPESPSDDSMSISSSSSDDDEDVTPVVLNQPSPSSDRASKPTGLDISSRLGGRNRTPSPSRSFSTSDIPSRSNSSTPVPRSFSDLYYTSSKPILNPSDLTPKPHMKNAPEEFLEKFCFFSSAPSTPSGSHDAPSIPLSYSPSSSLSTVPSFPNTIMARSSRYAGSNNLTDLTHSTGLRA